LGNALPVEYDDRALKSKDSMIAIHRCQRGKWKTLLTVGQSTVRMAALLVTIAWAKASFQMLAGLATPTPHIRRFRGTDGTSCFSRRQTALSPRRGVRR